ncbi:hypothetical protein LINPERPRIM_LOCUS29012, partial [Linum perenne]
SKRLSLSLPRSRSTPSISIQSAAHRRSPPTVDSTGLYNRGDSAIECRGKLQYPEYEAISGRISTPSPRKLSSPSEPPPPGKSLTLTGGE